MSSSSERAARPGVAVLRGAAAESARDAEFGVTICRPLRTRSDINGASGMEPGSDPSARFDEGYAAGLAAGLEVGRAQADEAARSLEATRSERAAVAVAVLDQAALAARDAYQAALRAVEDRLAAAAFELTVALVGRELELSSSSGEDAIARALALAPPAVALQVRVHPDDVVAIGDVEALAPSRSIVLLADPSVDRGGCVVDAGPCEIDAMIGAALERVREVLVDGR